jgi:amino acid permease
VRTSLFAAEMLSLDMLLKYWRNSRLTVESWSAGTLASVTGDYSR